MGQVGVVRLKVRMSGRAEVSLLNDNRIRLCLQSGGGHWSLWGAVKLWGGPLPDLLGGGQEAVMMLLMGEEGGVRTGSEVRIVMGGGGGGGGRGGEV